MELMELPTADLAGLTYLAMIGPDLQYYMWSVDCHLTHTIEAVFRSIKDEEAKNIAKHMLGFKNLEKPLDMETRRVIMQLRTGLKAWEGFDVTQI